MKCDVMNMLTQAARGNRAYAYSLVELANHLRRLMRGEVTLEEWNAYYVGVDRDSIDFDKLFPERK